MTDTNEIYTRLHQHKIDALFSQGPVAITMGTVGALIIFFVYLQTSIKFSITVWFCVYITVYLARFITFEKMNRTPVNYRNYRFMFWFYAISTMIAGLLWSGVSIYLLMTYNTFETLYVLLILGGLIAGSVATNIVLMSAFFAFVIPISLPVVIFLVIQDNPQLNIAGAFLGAFVLFVSSSAYRLNKLVSKSLSYQFENLKLLGELQQEKFQVTQLYSDLESDLAKRKETEEQLKVEKEKAEEMARSLLEISTLDGLTGIANRRHFDSILAKEWNRASRSHTPISLIMCDIDYFKAYNDHYGHQKGDNCLIQIANILKEHARRDDDLAARYGGEEFGIVLPATNLENAKEIAEQMRIAIHDAALPHRFSGVDNIVTASFGVAMVVPQRDQHSHNLVSRADKALYMAKKEGRNRVVAFSPQIISDDNDVKDSAVSGG